MVFSDLHSAITHYRMNFFIGIWNSLNEIWANKMRSFLTMLSISIGVASLVILVGLLQGMLIGWEAANHESGGLEKLSVIEDQSLGAQKTSPAISSKLTFRDAEMLAQLKHATVTAPQIYLEYSALQFNDKSCFVPVTASTHGNLLINNYQVKKGRTICDLDLAQSAKVTVIGTAVADALFLKNEDPLSKVITIDGMPFTIIGVLKNYSFMQGPWDLFEWKNKIAFIPITTLQNRIKHHDQLTSIDVRMKDVTEIQESIDEVTNIMIRSHHGIKNFRVEIPLKESIVQLKNSQTLFLIFGGSIGFLTLVVGGIGIMNLMFASIKMRVREIGIRKALGAWNFDILIQFLAESVTLSITGGIMGIATGVGIIIILKPLLAPIGPPQISLLAIAVGFGFSVLVGVLSGLYPAVEASRMDPIEALRYE